METKDRVIVIDLVGNDEDTVVKAEKAGHECRCGVCTCDGKEKAVGPELALQLYELPAPEAKSAPRFVPSVPLLGIARAVKKPYSH